MHRPSKIEDRLYGLASEGKNPKKKSQKKPKGKTVEKDQTSLLIQVDPETGLEILSDSMIAKQKEEKEKKEKEEKLDEVHGLLGKISAKKLKSGENKKKKPIQILKDFNGGPEPNQNENIALETPKEKENLFETASFGGIESEKGGNQVENEESGKKEGSKRKKFKKKGAPNYTRGATNKGPEIEMEEMSGSGFERQKTSSEMKRQGTNDGINRQMTSSAFNEELSPGEFTRQPTVNEQGNSEFNRQSTRNEFERQGTSTGYNRQGTSTGYNRQGTSTGYNRQGIKTGFERQPNSSGGSDPDYANMEFTRQPTIPNNYERQGTSSELLRQTTSSGYHRQGTKAEALGPPPPPPLNEENQIENNSQTTEGNPGLANEKISRQGTRKSISSVTGAPLNDELKKQSTSISEIYRRKSVSIQQLEGTLGPRKSISQPRKSILKEEQAPEKNEDDPIPIEVAGPTEVNPISQKENIKEESEEEENEIRGGWRKRVSISGASKRKKDALRDRVAENEAVQEFGEAQKDDGIQNEPNEEEETLTEKKKGRFGGRKKFGGNQKKSTGEDE